MEDLARPPLARDEEPSAASSATADTKGDTLAALALRIKLAEVPVGTTLCWRDWREARATTLRQALRRVRAASLAIRSSRHGEDAVAAGFAGHYRSLVGVARCDAAAAIDRVFDNYGAPADRDQVLIQACVEGVDIALVAASHAPGDGAPYRTISRAAGTDSAAITSGAAAAETYYVARDLNCPVDPLNARVLALLREIETKYAPSGTPFEVELALARGRLWLLQWRALPTVRGCAVSRVRRFRVARRAAVRALQRAAGHGAQPLFGLMPDWNPAELLGEHPRPLARSVFDALIARDTWWQARAYLGYRQPKQHRLVHAIGGRPYVDVRASFESLVPAQVDSRNASELVACWTRRLSRTPSLHDRVELAIAVTCAEFDAPARLHESKVRKATVRQLLPALQSLTQSVFDPSTLVSRRCAAERLARHRWEIPIEPGGLRAAVRRLRTLAALPFAVSARLDFIGAALLRSAARRGAIDPSWPDLLRSSAGTAAGDLLADLRDGSTLELHQRLADLRPGTFEIDVLAGAVWDALPRGSGAQRRAPATQLPAAQARALDQLLAAEGWSIDAVTLCAAVRNASRARDIGKWALSRGIAALMSGIAAWGTRRGLDRETLGWLTLPSIGAASRSDREWLPVAEAARRRHAAQQLLRMPTLLSSAHDLHEVHCVSGSPSFLGAASVSGALHVIDRHSKPHEVPLCAVLAIESADPGFDWIFTRRPLALLTAFGGPQSHMALRCVEQGLPAVLGLGLSRFRRVTRATSVQVDPVRQALDVLAMRD